MMQWFKGRQGWGGHTSVLRLGKIAVAEVFYDVSTGKSDPDKYGLTLMLPGMGKQKGNFPDRDTAKRTAVDLVNLWLNMTGLCITPADYNEEKKSDE